MVVFRTIVFVAALAGFVAGFAQTVLQTAFTVPLILKAERMERQVLATERVHAAASQASPVAAHDHDGGWSPADGFERTAFTAFFNVVVGFGFALLLAVGSELAGGMRDWRQGVYWGFSGFAVFVLAPGLGLPPELPAMPAADLLARQSWWIATALATAAGLGLIVFLRSAVFALLGLALIVASHVIGAPRPAIFESPIPEDLHHSFVIAVTVVNLVFWMILGAAVGAIRPYFAGGLSGLRIRSL